MKIAAPINNFEFCEDSQNKKKMQIVWIHTYTLTKMSYFS